MRWTLFAALSAVIATAMWLPADAAQPVTPPAAATAAPAEPDKTITFDEYRDWRLNYIERRRSEVAVQLSAPDLAAQQKARLEQVKAYYDWFAGLSEADRDRRFRERFDRIDANHDGRIDADERTSWREKQRAFYHRDGSARSQAAVAQ